MQPFDLSQLVPSLQSYRLLGHTVFVWPKSLQPEVAVLESSLAGIPCMHQVAVSHVGRRQESLACRAISLNLSGQLPVSAASGLPEWNDGWKGSFSHKQGHSAVWLGMGTDRNCGIDLERAADLRDGIIAKIMASHEQSMAEECLGETSSSLIFAMKEAIYKALYPQVQKFFYFDSVALTDACRVGDSAVCIFSVTKNLSSQVRQGALLKVEAVQIELMGDLFWLTLAQTECVKDRKGNI